MPVDSEGPGKGRSAVWSALRYRRLQAATIALLAAVVTACAVLAPLVDRSMRQALTAITLHAASAPDRGVEITSLTRAEAGTPPDTPYAPPLPSELAQALPRSARHLFEPPVAQRSVKTALPGRGLVPTSIGDLVWRAGACRHVRIVRGRCPSQTGDVLVSAADAHNFRLRPGQLIDVVEFDEVFPPLDTPGSRLRVVGVYDRRPGAYWFGHVVDGISGTAGPKAPQFHDTFLTAQQTFTGARATTWLDSRTGVDYQLVPSRVGVDDLLGLPEALDRTSHHLDDGNIMFSDTTQTAHVQSSLAELAATVDKGTAQGRVTVPLLMAQLGLLSAIVLALVLAAATDQRRREVAVARLRGRSPPQAASLVMRELAPPVGAGVVVGVVAAFVLDAVLRHTLLPGPAPFEVRWPELAAAAGAAVVLAGLAFLAARRVARRPVAELLRQVPPRRTGWAVGVGDAVVLAASGTAVLAFVTGDLQGPLAVVAPTLLSVVAGLVLAYLVAPVATRLGSVALARGRYAAVSLLATARRPSTRRVVTIVTVGASLVVFSSQAVLIGVRNRASAAEQAAGAPTTATVRSGRLDTVQSVLRSLHDRHVTPVVAMQSPGEGTSTTAVVPSAFRRIAYTDGLPRAGWSRLTPATAEPVRLTGTRLSLRARVAEGFPGLALSMVVLQHDGRLTPVRIGSLPFSGTRVLRADVPCEEGCVVTRLGVAAGPTLQGDATVTLDRPRVTGGSTSLPGPASAWSTFEERGTGTIRATQRGDALRMTMKVVAADTLRLSSRWAPASLPTLVARSGRHRLPRSASGNRLDGTVITLQPVASLPRVPGRDNPTLVVDLDVLKRSGRYDPGSAVISLWFDTERAGELARVRAALARHGVRLEAPVRHSVVRASLDRSVPAWSLDLGLLVAVAALLIALLMLVLVAATTWRTRARDLAALRMAGLPASACRRLAALEQVPAVVLAVVVGSVCGLVGARVALARVPLFAERPSVSTLDLSTPWWLVVTAAAVCLVLLGATAALTGRYAARRATLDQVRETL